MYPIPGHLAVSILAARATRCRVAVAVAAGFFPDVVDKPLNDLLGLTDSGRTIAHSLLGLAAMTSIVWWMAGRSWGLAWLVGHLGHILADANFMPLLYPFVDYPAGRPINLFTWEGLMAVFRPGQMAAEMLLLVLALMALGHGRWVTRHRKAFAFLCAATALGALATTF